MATPKKKIMEVISLNVDVLVDGAVKTELKQFTYSPTTRTKDNRFYVSIPVEVGGITTYKQVTGKTPQRLKLNIVRWYEKHLAEQLENNQIESDKLLEDAVRDWLQTRELKDTSRDAMEDVLEKYVFPAIGNKKVGDVKTDDIKKIVDEMKKRLLSYSYIRKPVIHLNTYYNSRIKAGALTYNPCKAVELPNKRELNKKRKESNVHVRNKYFTKSQVQAIQNVIYNGYRPKGVSRAKKEYLQPLRYITQGMAFDFLLQTGLRASELCGLKYSDWNPETHYIIIEENYVPTHERDDDGKRTGRKTATAQTPKTEKSEAPLHISNKANEILVKMKELEPDDYDGYVVHTAEGKPITRDVLRGRYYRLLKAAGIETDHEEYGLHCTRHTYASFLYQKSKDMQLVSNKLRHSNAAFTAAVYVDLLPDEIEDIDATFEV